MTEEDHKRLQVRIHFQEQAQNLILKFADELEALDDQPGGTVNTVVQETARLLGDVIFRVYESTVGNVNDGNVTLEEIGFKSFDHIKAHLLEKSITEVNLIVNNLINQVDIIELAGDRTKH